MNNSIGRFAIVVGCAVLLDSLASLLIWLKIRQPLSLPEFFWFMLAAGCIGLLAGLIGTKWAAHAPNGKKNQQ